MKYVLLSLVALISVSSVSANGFTPKAGSCTSGGGGAGLCACDLVSTTVSASMLPSIIHAAPVSCSLLACSDFIDADHCGGLKYATCDLTNDNYPGVCSQEVRYDPSTNIGAGDSCAQVARELNTPMNQRFSFGESYCNATPIRTGWNLISVADDGLGQ